MSILISITDDLGDHDFVVDDERELRRFLGQIGRQELAKAHALAIESLSKSSSKSSSKKKAPKKKK